jgi:hypothetical protein
VPNSGRSRLAESHPYAKRWCCRRPPAPPIAAGPAGGFLPGVPAERLSKRGCLGMGGPSPLRPRPSLEPSAEGPGLREAGQPRTAPRTNPTPATTARSEPWQLGNRVGSSASGQAKPRPLRGLPAEQGPGQRETCLMSFTQQANAGSGGGVPAQKRPVIELLMDAGMGSITLRLFACRCP